MKAVDLKPGDVIKRCPDEPELEGWTVAKSDVGRRLEGDRRTGVGSLHGVVLLKLVHYGRKRYTRTAFLPADAEVEVED